MIEKYDWEKPRGIILYKEKDFMIIHKKGYLTVACQCFKDCDCAINNRIKTVELYRVCGRNRQDRVPKPHNFDTFDQAMQRINQLKLTNL